MFGKFLLTVAVVAIIWFGYRYLARLAELKRARESGRPIERRPEQSKVDAAETLVECRVCGTWQSSRGAKSCGRSDCPY